MSPTTQSLDEVDVRDFTQATLCAQVKVYLPIPAVEAMAIVTDFAVCPDWVSPAPEAILADISAGPDGAFRPGSVVRTGLAMSKLCGSIRDWHESRA